MTDQSEIGTVLASVTRLERAFGRNLGAIITLIGLYLARRTSGNIRLLASILLVVALALQVFLKILG